MEYACDIPGLVFEPDEDLLRPTRQGPRLNQLPPGTRWPEGVLAWRADAPFAFST